MLLFGTDNMIASACAHHKTDCIYRVYNRDRYDDRDVFEIIIPLTTGAMTKVGPEISSEISGQVVKWSSWYAGSTQAEYASSTQDQYAGSTQAVTISLDVQKLNDLLDYCSEPRTRAEMQEFCGIKTREYFRKKILVPMINSGKILQTILEHPNSPNQRYIKA